MILLKHVEKKTNDQNYWNIFAEENMKKREAIVLLLFAFYSAYTMDNKQEKIYLQWIEEKKEHAITTHYNTLATQWIKYTIFKKLSIEKEKDNPTIIIPWEYSNKPVFNRNYDNTLLFRLEKIEDSEMLDEIRISKWDLLLYQIHNNIWKTQICIKTYNLSSTTELEYKGMVCSQDGKSILVKVEKDHYEIIRLPENIENSNIIQDAEMVDSFNSMQL